MTLDGPIHKPIVLESLHFPEPVLSIAIEPKTQADMDRLAQSLEFWAALGALLVNFFKTIFTTGFLAPFWLFALGGLFITVTLALPNGVLALIETWTQRRVKPKPADLGAARVAQPAE